MNSKEKRDDIVCNLYEKLLSANKVATLSKLNPRTVRRILENRGYVLKKSSTALRTPLLLINIKSNEIRQFKSVLRAAKFLNNLDIMNRTKKLADPKSFTSGLDFKVYSINTYRVYIHKYLDGEISRLHNMGWHVEKYSEEDLYE